MIKKLSYKYYNKRITIRDNGNVQFHDQEESKLSSIITANSGAHTLTHDQIRKKSIHTHFESFLPSTYKSGTVYTLAYRCFRIYSSWTKLHNKLLCLKENVLKNGYLEDFMNKFFKKFMDNIHVVQETTLTVKKKPLVLVLLYLGSISLQTRTKLKKSLKCILNCCKL